MQYDMLLGLRRAQENRIQSGGPEVCDEVEVEMRRFLKSSRAAL